MRVVITGGAGFLGKKLALALLARGTLIGGDGTVQSLSEITLFDVVEPEGLLRDPRLAVRTGDIGDAAQVREVIGDNAAGVFHLAAVVSANAEQDFDLGYRVNLDGTRNVLEACRRLAAPARLVFASSVAVYGGDMPDVLDDGTILTPQTSYGTQKAMGELMVSDYSRKGFVDGRALRLPTIVVRPGKPNLAASTFASSIIREPLVGEEVVCPVERDAEMYILSPRRVIESLIHGFELPEEALRPVRMLTLPGITVSVGQMVEALRQVAGDQAVERIRWEPNPTIQRIVAGWPRRFDAQRARELGFKADADMVEIIDAHVEDELRGLVK
jgi:nucleoside-diphosphate-sugar epimerase